MKKDIGLWGWIGIVIFAALIIKFWWLLFVAGFVSLGYFINHKYTINSTHKTRNSVLTWVAVAILSLLFIGSTTGNSTSTATPKKESQTDTVKLKKTSAVKHKQASQTKAKKAKVKKAKVAKQQNTDDLANLQYNGTQTIDVNGRNPTFSADDLSTTKGSWQDYGNLDSYNRLTHADALINHAMQPTAKREPLTVNPTGWRNKKIGSGYLYNRSHLIGYQLTGQNNNPKNLITGTRSMNSPEMLHYEDDIAYYLKTNPNGHVRYQVVPVFKGDELVARGVHMQAQSIGSNSIHFNVYIFNIQSGVEINYQDGTSKVTSGATSSQNSETIGTTGVGEATRGDMNTTDSGKVVGNKNSHIYHVPGQSGYRMNSSNAVYFNTEQDAQVAGYRKALR